ncbi:hypothetical protein ACO0SA_002929 [Hanseniaspora valbyensis]
MSFTVEKTIKTCRGKLLKLSHNSAALKCKMVLNVYIPKQFYENVSVAKNKIPSIFYLSGLTCTPENCTEKGFIQIQADKYGFAVIYPDTSPRNVTFPKDCKIDPNDWALGEGAGFYLDSDTLENFQMGTYISEELPQSLASSTDLFEDKIDFLNKRSIMGHSMGGMGALNFYLNSFARNSNGYVSCSAFAPVVNPTAVPWGQNAFKLYFKDYEHEGKKLDPTLILKNKDFSDKILNILISSGDADPFLENQLKPQNLIDVVTEKNIKGIRVNIEPGYDHSYFFVSTFIPEHCEFHAKKLGLIDNLIK